MEVPKSEEESKQPLVIERTADPLAEFDEVFKIIFVGDTGVGKTCIIKRTDEDKFEEAHSITIGGDFAKLFYSINQKRVKVQLWDTCGLEQYRSMIKIFFKGSDACLIVFDLTSEKSFYAVPRWLADVRENTSPSAKVYLIGNKSDLPQRPVPSEAISSYVSSAGINGYFEVSAKTAQGLDKMLRAVLGDVYKMKQELYRSLPVAAPDSKTKLQRPEKHKSKRKGKCC